MMRMVGSPLNHPSITLQLQSNHFISSQGQVFFGFVLLWTFIFICKVLLEIVLQVIVFWKYCCLKLAASFVNDSCYWAEKGHYRPRGMSPLLNHWFSTTLDIFVNTLIIVIWWLDVTRNDPYYTDDVDSEEAGHHERCPVYNAISVAQPFSSAPLHHPRWCLPSKRCFNITTIINITIISLILN